mgnify:FL=1
MGKALPGSMKKKVVTYQGISEKSHLSRKSTSLLAMVTFTEGKCDEFL